MYIIQLYQNGASSTIRSKLDAVLTAWSTGTAMLKNYVEISNGISKKIKKNFKE
jgi:hypothetical protein